MYEREALVVTAVGALFVVMALSFVGIPWPTELHEIPVANQTGDRGVANSLFDPFAITVILIAILLGAAMIGGVYLAKMDEPGKVGP